MVNCLTYFIYILIAKQLEVQVGVNYTDKQPKCFDTAPRFES